MPYDSRGPTNRDTSIPWSAPSAAIARSSSSRRSIAPLPCETRLTRLPALDVEDRRPPVLQRPLAGVGEPLKLVLVDEVRVLALAAARNARVPRERGPGRDRRGEPAALDLRRHHLELALPVADRAAL